MENKINIQAELELTKKLLNVVNSKEEFDYLTREVERLTSLLSCLIQLKGGARKW